MQRAARHHEGVAITLTTWNIQGRRRPNLSLVADQITTQGADVVLLQEVQWYQARRLARRLGWTATWHFKHWPVIAPPEGLAVLTPQRPLAAQRVLLAAAPWWSWRRRVALRVDVAMAAGALYVVDMHLGTGVGEAERVRQAGTVLAVAPSSRTVIGGDANAGPTSGVIGRIVGDGYVDAWAARHADAVGATNWAPGPRTEAPTQRIDYLFVSGDLRIDAASVPIDAASSARDIAAFGALSDHLPLTVVVDW